ncbi:MAG: Flp family type IVb pilin [Gemmatimonadaceae bacterium]|nr:Flp family type IVb pilin [Gemmatimonadaceae bacterium]
MWYATRESRLRAWREDEHGASLVEYGLLVLLIALVAIATVNTFGSKVAALFTEADGKLPNS